MFTAQEARCILEGFWIAGFENPCCRERQIRPDPKATLSSSQGATAVLTDLSLVQCSRDTICIVFVWEFGIQTSCKAFG